MNEFSRSSLRGLSLEYSGLGGTRILALVILLSHTVLIHVKVRESPHRNGGFKVIVKGFW